MQWLLGSTGHDESYNCTDGEHDSEIFTGVDKATIWANAIAAGVFFAALCFALFI